jgi:TIR domain
MNTEDVPEVFLSHAGEDNDRFARGFAKRLQEKGFRVWFDEWELLPGDSLVDKIFEEGLKSAEAMVVVVSANSVDKPWVREELNAGFVKRIEGKCKLIPVIIDDVEMPEALKPTVHQRIHDLQNYEVELDRVARAIRGDRNCPEPGAVPAYARTVALPGLYSTDTRVLQIAGDIALEQDHRMIDSLAVLERCAVDGITEEAFLESLQVLEEHGYIEVARTFGAGISGMSAFTVTLAGLEEYASAFVPQYDDLAQRVIAELVNAPDQVTDGAIGRAIDAPRLLVEHILDMLDARGLVKLTKLTGPSTPVFSVSPQLGRLLQGRG